MMPGREGAPVEVRTMSALQVPSQPTPPGLSLIAISLQMGFLKLRGIKQLDGGYAGSMC